MSSHSRVCFFYFKIYISSGTSKSCVAQLKLFYFLQAVKWQTVLVCRRVCIPGIKFILLHHLTALHRWIISVDVEVLKLWASFPPPMLTEWRRGGGGDRERKGERGRWIRERERFGVNILRTWEKVHRSFSYTWFWLFTDEEKNVNRHETDAFHLTFIWFCNWRRWS